MEEYEYIAELEGYDIEEAKLTYAARQKLPTSAFCGPNKTYPAQDAAHVRNALARLRFVKSKAMKAKIMACLRRRAKKFGVEINETVSDEEREVEKTDSQIVDWYLNELGIKQ